MADDLFGEWRSSLPFGQGQEAPTANATAVPIEYPMYVIPMAALLALEALPPHQNCLASGILQPWSEDMRGKIIFVSHRASAALDPVNPDHPLVIASKSPLSLIFPFMPPLGL